MAGEEARKDKILVGTRDEQVFSFDPSINYEPLKRYIVLTFSFFDSSSADSTESSASLFSDSESKTETMAKKEAQSQEDKILAGSIDKHFIWNDLVMFPTSDLQLQ
ncbi:hypothetical protein POM88_051358 [Heracleum sosnowskyi]|uniref:Uncharacterized protein n=1 Tax=Heracleum sosnowskyi TaxID=360622 RepID=A0AAD8GZC9_9APIA|nr:hypothetical protein POM88_051358 [Heracleum sosnowskyi]